MTITLRIFLALLTLSASTLATSAEPGEHTIQGPQIDVRLSVADPCLNSRYADLSACKERLTQRTSEKSELIQLHTDNGEVVHFSPGTSYIVRTTDFY
ncbi:hypothetical protein [uncultured Oxalicibacterium sp.]|uniref:hypothetical protein n=1 Tax=uncultured Oxalicibacterium sp. TaxID=1168540 RepID=UPI0025E1AF47|nr:hypothetical protein [uncultured Oxalicibacterium sp.]